MLRCWACEAPGATSAHHLLARGAIAWLPCSHHHLPTSCLHRPATPPRSGTGAMGSRRGGAVNGHHALWTSACTNVLVTK